MSLPIFYTQDKDISLLQTTWSAPLNQLLAKPLSSSNFLEDITLTSGDNVINHKLGRMLQGWIIADMFGAFAQVYRKNSTMPDKTLVLNSSGTTVVNLIVF